MYFAAVSNIKNLFFPTLPSISGVTPIALWQAGYGDSTTLRDAIGNYDAVLLSLVCGVIVAIMLMLSLGAPPKIEEAESAS
jgi:hypothetical protein